MAGRGFGLSRGSPLSASASAAPTFLLAKVGFADLDRPSSLPVLAAGAADFDVRSIANVLDVLGNRSVRPDAVFVHESDQFALLHV